MLQEKTIMKKELGLLFLSSIGVSAIVGSGIFAFPAAMAAIAGPGYILAILLGGLITLLFALGYAELGSAFPLTGGPYAFSKLALGNLSGFLIGWGYFLYLFISTAAVADILTVFLGFYFKGLVAQGTLTSLGITVAVLLLWLLTLINILGVRIGAAVAFFSAIVKIFVLLLFCVLGLFFMQADHFSPFFPYGFSGVIMALILFFWAFTGFESCVIPAEEIKRPSRNIPLAILISIGVSLFIYLFVSIVFIGITNWGDIQITIHSWNDLVALSFPLADSMYNINMTWMIAFIVLGAVLGAFGTVSSFVLIQGRLPYAMAKDRLFWTHLADIHPRFSTPSNALLLSSLLSTIVLISIPNFPSVVLIASITIMLPYAAAMLSLVVLRKTHSQEARPFRVPFVFGFALLGFIIATYLNYWACWPWTLVGPILIMIGYVPFYLCKIKEAHGDRHFWLPAYLLGITIISFIGDPTFVFNNFTPVTPLGWLKLPYDMIILTFFAVSIFFWAYKTNIHYLPQQKAIEKSAVSFKHIDMKD